METRMWVIAKPSYHVRTQALVMKTRWIPQVPGRAHGRGALGLTPFRGKRTMEPDPDDWVIGAADERQKSPSRKEMSQAPEHGQLGPQGEQEHVSVHTEASSFTPQHEVPEPLVPQLNAVPEGVTPPMVVVTIEKLKKNGAEEFCGDQIAEPMVAKRWLERVSRVLRTLRVPAEQRGNLAIALLQDAAYDWWKRAGANIPEPVPWATFDELFREEYVPEHFMEEKRDEFMKFMQGELTLPEYRQKFDELAEFGRDLVPTMEKRNDINDLHKQALELQTALLKKAEYEQSQTMHPRPSPPSRSGSSSKRPPHIPSSSHSSKKVRSAPATSSAPTQKSRYRNSICNLCGRRHSGECWFTQGLCLGCGQAGHYRRNCPTNPGEAFPTAPAAVASALAAQPAPSQKPVAASSQPKRPAQGTQSGKAPARTYVMHGHTEQPAHDVIMGMFTLFDTSKSALIDPGSTLSYLCTSVPESFNIPRENLENPVIVSNPLGHSLCLKYIYSDCPLVVQGKSFPANLIKLPHREFDVILGMDWVTANQAVVDCGAHTVRLKAKDGNDVLIRGELFPKAPEFISYMQARRLICKKCEAFLCTVRDTQREAPGREEIPTVCEFPDVFPDELPGLPPPRESSDGFCRQTYWLASRGEKPDFSVREDGVLLYRARVVVPVGEWEMLLQFPPRPKALSTGESSPSTCSKIVLTIKAGNTGLNKGLGFHGSIDIAAAMILQ
ncbi:unnamed protein product [Cuscuta campestris]|uniref:CCHC-type domain-containing protein n=1 Tax=Cuscuta campestris TaxID=132261 RepID=A0A484KX31_9ASTE|nr:unnamed protein product [Cuscuta campestris]